MVKAQLLGYAGQRAPTRGCAGRQAVEQRAAVVQPPRYRSCTPQPVRGNAALRHGAHHPPPEPNSGSAEPEAADRRPDRQRESVRSQHAHQCRHVRMTVAQVRAGRQVWFRTVGRSRYTFRGGRGPVCRLRQVEHRDRGSHGAPCTRQESSPLRTGMYFWHSCCAFWTAGSSGEIPSDFWILMPPFASGSGNFANP